MDYHRFLSAFPRTYLGRGSPDRRQIALTFDDGPGSATPALLAVLRELAVKATFFCLGDAATRQPDIVRAIIQDGHDLGSHGYSHCDLQSMSVDMFRDAHVIPAATILEALAGNPVTLFRPPYGEITPAQVEWLDSAGHTLVGWSIDPKDWQHPEAPDHVERVVRTVVEQAHSGAIVLLHDGDEGEQVRHAIPAVVRELVPALRREGYVFAGISELRQGLGHAGHSHRASAGHLPGTHLD